MFYPWTLTICTTTFLVKSNSSISTGEFAIQPEKKAPAVIKKAKHVGMIAGGTGMGYILWV